MGKRFKEKNMKISLTKIALWVCIITFIISLAKIIQWLIYNKNNKIALEKVANAVTIEEVIDENGNKKQEYKINFKKLKEDNADTVAWIIINETNIELPVVKGTDNEYYLTHNFYKKYNEAGWIFSDYKNKIDGTDRNIVLYGHNRKNGTMFSNLNNVLKPEWYEKTENREITFFTEKGKFKYEIFSIYKIENEDYYIQTEFTEDTFKEYIETVSKRSIKDFGIEVTTEDKLLTLSTCANNNDYRVVIHAKKTEIN